MKRKTRRRMRQRGFTLLEVLLVLAILVILGSTVTYFYANTQDKANKRAAMVQINALENVMEEYRIDVGTYPTTQQGLAALTAAPGELADERKWGGPYLKKQVPGDPWNNQYQYRNNGPLSFTIWSFGPDGQDGSGDEVSNMPMQ